MIHVETHIIYRAGYEACLRHIVELFETRSGSFKKERIANERTLALLQFLNQNPYAMIDVLDDEKTIVHFIDNKTKKSVFTLQRNPG